MIRILANDGMNKNAVNGLIDLGYEVVEDHYDKDELLVKIKEFDVLVVRSATKVTKEVIDAATVKGAKLKLIIRAGVGVDNIDVTYARDKGLTVNNTPNASSASVAELAIGHMFAVSRFINTANVTMRQGKWEKKAYTGTEIFGKTLGLIGFGRIAREVAKRAEALGMKVIYNDICGKVVGYDSYEFYDDINGLLREADFVSLHIPYDKKKGYVIGDNEFNAMKDGAFLINCARGGVVSEQALLNAINNGKIRGAALDVFENEPKPCAEILDNPRVSVTPHIGASTKEAQARIGEEIVNIVENTFK
ncbi:D-3-phosphoglycerate dehydrogenase [Clostridium acetobutylicum]|uniref:D-3-phosphoglycerate dehydrogenase n=1 Tax=Clostridium acetobutylicum (strain ATCC 824 / DSM 792 / JCM 1419 / IAM 19013 / LMG 5710 / NBRC 13948 / NRRL B-527 / VKM B-1787 / 2291 / W) TaxID=272562 RepID=Q97N23_CLOAB|nr:MULTISPECIES: NAD(P)-dependent oxidoreductase [Clostridium]AAK78002.1 D-3-phosphoglycerate dehydrogenase [Clostridium acetobutylicum ATCC 824]ADZ19058.1 D-3-phosphoglycerate dehydrogenase [Clostridium acetobutylicum EA 2018]AEI34098.1 D-3-phosphoglycerate dehydrogenase [Clostridium acetobutylicum DSM 1731]AWV81935.1 D-3-phosphoglycerate dehydrogenase [Clostridium acetobutylicum]MBC2395485.1 D-3-phosphoglycerate dehydrogenase [Clostridium acetobutylicum]